MTALAAFVRVVLAVATPANLASVRAVIGALAAIGALRKDDGAAVTEAELTALWAEARAEFATLGAEAEASTKRITG